MLNARKLEKEQINKKEKEEDMTRADRVISINPCESTLASRTGIAERMLVRKRIIDSRYERESASRNCVALQRFLLPASELSRGASVLMLAIRLVSGMILLILGVGVAYGFPPVLIELMSGSDVGRLTDLGLNHNLMLGTLEIILGVLLSAGIGGRVVSILSIILMLFMSSCLSGVEMGVTLIASVMTVSVVARGSGKVSIDYVLSLIRKNSKKVGALKNNIENIW